LTFLKNRLCTKTNADSTLATRVQQSTAFSIGTKENAIAMNSATGKLAKKTSTNVYKKGFVEQLESAEIWIDNNRVTTASVRMVKSSMGKKNSVKVLVYRAGLEVGQLLRVFCRFRLTTLSLKLQRELMLLKKSGKLLKRRLVTIFSVFLTI